MFCSLKLDLYRAALEGGLWMCLSLPEVPECDYWYFHTPYSNHNIKCYQMQLLTSISTMVYSTIIIITVSVMHTQTGVEWKMHIIGGGGWMDCDVQWTRMEQDSSL